MAGPEDDGKRHGGESRYRCAALLHPVRLQMLRLVRDDRELGAGELAEELEQPPARIGYHLRILVRRHAFRVVSRRRPNPPRYRQAQEAEWVRKFLAEVDAEDAGDA